MTTPGTPLRGHKMADKNSSGAGGMTPGIDESLPFLLRDSATCDSFRSGVVSGSAFEARNSRQNGVRQNPTLPFRSQSVSEPQKKTLVKADHGGPDDRGP
ncbi:hypothetical protein THAOC_05809, partial [Thalassiosira oceanica]